MDLPSHVEGYIQQTIEHFLGLPISSEVLQMKLLAAEYERNRLQERVFQLEDELKEKDMRIHQSRAESASNAQALKKFIEENEKLRSECGDLLCQCEKLEKECALYDRDREALMEFGNEADERAKECETRALEAEEQSRRTAAELEVFKREYDMLKERETSVTKELQALRQRTGEVECTRLDRSENVGETCSQCRPLKKENQELLSKLLSPVPLAGEGVAELAAEIEVLRKDKEYLRINLHRAEEEVKLLFEDNSLLEEENRRLVRQCKKERQRKESGGKHTGGDSIKGKRKLRARTTDGIQADNSNGTDLTRQPLSPLKHNSPELRKHKK